MQIVSSNGLVMAISVSVFGAGVVDVVDVELLVDEVVSDETLFFVPGIESVDLRHAQHAVAASIPLLA